MQPAAATDLAGVVKKGRPGRLRRILVRVGVIAVVGGLVAGVSWCRHRDTKVVIAYQTAPLAAGALTVSVTATGTLEARDVVAVGSEVSGGVASGSPRQSA